MRSLLLLSLVLIWTGSCSAQKPKQCHTPPLLSGSMSVSAREGQDWAFAKYSYDAFRQRIRVWEFGNVEKKSFHLNMLFLFREGVVYSIDYKNRTCQKNPLHAAFHPSHIPRNASLLSQVVLGGSSAPGEGLLVNTWTGDVPQTGGKYLATVTEFGCIPVSTLYHTPKSGWVVTTYFNTVTGIEDPEQFIPPAFCDDTETEEEELDFFSGFAQLDLS
ncbi:ependymin-like 1 [Pimephales promelas]|uniref:ependymin-like 1 n=1 Tax=Pimephales promelas TaxID=90988 RepID=UPI0019559FCD|nr:ependymin-like 1 [Pimephales promelas]KAG1928114.1 mammalian ependymin-related protein [Pimephales promelas]